MTYIACKDNKSIQQFGKLDYVIHNFRTINETSRQETDVIIIYYIIILIYYKKSILISSLIIF